MSINALPFWKNKKTIMCKKEQFLDVLEKAIYPSSSLRLDMPQANTNPEQLSGVVDGSNVFLTSGKSHNWLWAMILRGRIIEMEGDKCEMQYRFVPCIPFIFIILTVNYWFIDFRTEGEELVKMLMSLMVINIVFLCLSISQCARIQRLLESVIKRACSFQTNTESSGLIIDLNMEKK